MPLKMQVYPPERTAVILGRGNYIGAGMTRLEQHVRTAEQLSTPFSIGTRH